MTDLWNEAEAVLMESDLHFFPVNVPADFAPDGGIRIYLVERAS